MLKQRLYITIQYSFMKLLKFKLFIIKIYIQFSIIIQHHDNYNTNANNFIGSKQFRESPRNTQTLQQTHSQNSNVKPQSKQGQALKRLQTHRNLTSIKHEPETKPLDHPTRTMATLVNLTRD